MQYFRNICNISMCGNSMRTWAKNTNCWSTDQDEPCGSHGVRQIQQKSYLHRLHTMWLHPPSFSIVDRHRGHSWRQDHIFMSQWLQCIPYAKLRTKFEVSSPNSFAAHHMTVLLIEYRHYNNWRQSASKWRHLSPININSNYGPILHHFWNIWFQKYC